MECGREVVVCICGRPLSFVGGWDGRSSSPVGLPALWVVLLWSFGGLPFVGSGGERRSYVVSCGGRCRSRVVVGALLSVFADARPRSWVLMVGDWWPLSIERGSGGLLSVFAAPVLARGS